MYHRLSLQAEGIVVEMKIAMNLIDEDMRRAFMATRDLQLIDVGVKTVLLAGANIIIFLYCVARFLTVV